MVSNIPRIDSSLNLDQCTIHWCHGLPNCDNWLSSHELGLWFQVGKVEFFCSQICRGGLHVLIILNWNGSCGADLESKLLTVGTYTTIFLDIRDWLRRDMWWNVPWIFECHVRLHFFYGGAGVPAGTWYYSLENLVSYCMMPRCQWCEDWVDAHLYLMCST